MAKRKLNDPKTQSKFAKTTPALQFNEIDWDTLVVIFEQLTLPELFKLSLTSRKTHQLVAEFIAAYDHLDTYLQHMKQLKQFRPLELKTATIQQHLDYINLMAHYITRAVQAYHKSISEGMTPDSLSDMVTLRLPHILTLPTSQNHTRLQLENLDKEQKKYLQIYYDSTEKQINDENIFCYTIPAQLYATHLWQGADPNVLSPQDNLTLTAFPNDLAELLFRSVANAQSMLLKAVVLNNLEAAKLLLAHSANIVYWTGTTYDKETGTQTSFYSPSCLLIAAAFNLDDMIEVLLKYGADPLATHPFQLYNSNEDYFLSAMQVTTSPTCFDILFAALMASDYYKCNPDLIDVDYNESITQSLKFGLVIAANMQLKKLPTTPNEQISQVFLEYLYTKKDMIKDLPPQEKSAICEILKIPGLDLKSPIIKKQYGVSPCIWAVEIMLEINDKDVCETFFDLPNIDMGEPDILIDTANEENATHFLKAYQDRLQRDPPRALSLSF